VGDYRKLNIWIKAHELTRAVYRHTARFPPGERYGLTSQLRRCAVSLGSNMVEGSGRRSDGDMRRFLQIARGSLCELQYQLLLARDLEYLSRETWDSLAAVSDEIGRMLVGLSGYFKRSHESKRGSHES
jgi:four helix bundle protein